MINHTPECLRRIVLAATVRERLVGLLSGRVCPHGETLMLVPCHSIHTYGMREDLDVAFLDRSMRVLEAHRGVPCGRLLANRDARIVLERRASSDPWHRPGDVLEFTEGEL